jgi:hypothetical protein
VLSPLILFILICFFIFVVIFNFILKKGKGISEQNNKKN